MPVAAGSLELWRRIALLLGILLGLAMFFYVAPAMVSVTAIDWLQEQADELKSYGIVSEESKRLNQLPLPEYINEKTGGRVVQVDVSQGDDFFWQVWLASIGEYGLSAYGHRVSEKDKDPFWTPAGAVEVFFKPGEIPWAEWGLIPEDGEKIYVRVGTGSENAYFLLRYYDYKVSIGTMSKPYRVAPAWLYYPYRHLGSGILAVGLLLYVFLPRRKKEATDISYSTGSMVAGDLSAVILLLPFYGLPFLINGGTTQAVTGMWVISGAMWLIALFCIILLYYNAWYASYRIELSSEGLCQISFKGVKKCDFNEITQVNMVKLRNPGWFRKLSLALAFLAIMGGRASTQPAGSALLTAAAAYGGLEICRKNGPPIYVWFTNQNGGIILNNFTRLTEVIESAGVSINKQQREIEGFSMFM